MRKKSQKIKKTNKGTSSAVLLSILIHAGLFFLAGLLVVFTVVKKEEQVFEPPKAVERPKMKLKKPRVKVKKSSRPKSSARITSTRAIMSAMPSIDLPGVGGLGDGLGDGIGGFDMMPDYDQVTMFGSKISIGNDLEGTFYDFKRDRTGRTIAVDYDGWAWRQTINRFLKEDWKSSVFARYYQAPQKLYATMVVVPVTKSGIAPVSFGDEEAVGALWAVHYKGQLVHKEGIKFRFWGMGDEFIIVRVGGEIVLGAWWPDDMYRGPGLGNLWRSSAGVSESYQWGHNKATVGDWIELKPGESKDLEILIGDNGGIAAFILGVEEEGVDYEYSGQPSPILPAFKTAQPTHDMLDLIYKEFPVGDVCLTNGPVFNDIPTRASIAAAPKPPVEEAVPDAEPEPSSRAWTLVDGRSFEAEFVTIVGGKAVFKPRKGSLCKIPMADLSLADREFIELSRPPDIDLNFTRSTRQVVFSGGFYDATVLGMHGFWARPQETRARFGVSVKQTSPGDYNQELHAEIFAVGLQLTTPDKRYMLLDRQETSFSLTKENDRSYEFKSDREAVLTKFEIYEQPRGEKYFGYLVVVRDSRGEIIAMKASSDWLAEHRENLENLEVGNYFDKTCTRVYPGRPRPFWK